MDKKKPYITQLQEELALYRFALDSVEAWHEAERKVRNTSYKRDAELKADIARDRMNACVKAAKEYGGKDD